MAGEKAVHHQKTLLEILSGATRKNRAFSADESVQLSHDGGRDSAFEVRKTLDTGEGLAALNFDQQKATFSAGGGPVVAGDHSAIKIMASAARVAGTALISLALAGAAVALGFMAWDAVTPNPWDQTIDLEQGIICPSNGSLGSSFLSLIVGCK